MEKVKDILHLHKDKHGHHGTSGTTATGQRGAHGTTTAPTGAGGTHGHTGGVPGGVAAPGGAGSGANVPSAHGHGGGKTVGVGAGSDYPSAKQAATEAARQKDDVAFNTNTGSAAGRPVGSTGGATTGHTGGAGTGHTGGVTTGSGAGHNTGGKTVGVGTGTDHPSAKEAAREAAARKDDVAVNTRSGTAAGTPVGTTGAGATAGTGATTGAGNVIDRKFYTGVEERPQDHAVVEKYREHNPYEKEYETTVQHTGRERQVGSHVEALGTEERVIGQDNLTSAPHAHIDRAVPTGSVNERPGGEGWVQGKAGPVCDSKTFVVPGDRTVDKERVTNLRDHRDFEKEFEVATRLKGEHDAGTRQPELLDRDRVLLDEKKKVACEGGPRVE